MIGQCERLEDICTYRCISTEAISDNYDCVFVDGDHRLEIVAVEAELLVHSKVRTIMAHDVNAMHVGFAGCEGAAFLMEYLGDNGYAVVYDCKDRPGERTDRGFMFATGDAELYERVVPLFEEPRMEMIV